MEVCRPRIRCIEGNVFGRRIKKLFWRKKPPYHIAPALADLIVETSRVDVGQFAALLKSEGEEFTDDSALSVFLEMTVFYLNVVDRRAFGLLGADRRESFMDRLLDVRIPQLSDLLALKLDTFAGQYADFYNSRLAVYAQYTLDSTVGDTIEGNYVWETAKVLVNEACPERRDLYILVMATLADSLQTFSTAEDFLKLE